MKKFKANDNKSEEHEINYRQFNKKLELLNQILSLISDINQASDEKEVKDCIPALLQYIGEYTDADRVYIFDSPKGDLALYDLSLIHISEPTRPY